MDCWPSALPVVSTVAPRMRADHTPRLLSVIPTTTTRYPTNRDGKVTLAEFAPVFTRLMSEVVEQGPRAVPQDSTPPPADSHRPALNWRQEARHVSHIRDENGRAMARALAKKKLEAETGDVPITRQYPVLCTNTAHRLPDSPTVDAFPVIDLHKRPVVSGTTTLSPSKPAFRGNGASAAAADTLNLGGTAPASSSPFNRRPPATPALSVLSAGSGSSTARSGSGAPHMAIIRRAVRGKGRWRAAFKALRRRDASGAEAVTVGDFLAALREAGIVAAVQSSLGDDATSDDALAVLRQAAARYPGGVARSSRRSAMAPASLRSSRSSSALGAGSARAGATVAYVRFMRKVVPASNAVVFLPSRTVPHLPSHMHAQRPATSGSLRSHASLDTEAFAAQTPRGARGTPL